MDRIRADHFFMLVFDIGCILITFKSILLMVTASELGPMNNRFSVGLQLISLAFLLRYLVFNYISFKKTANH